MIIRVPNRTNEADFRNPGSRKRPTTADSRVAQKADETLPSASRRRFGRRWCVRLLDCTQTSRESTHIERAHEDSVPGWVDPSQANQEVDLLQARRAQDRANQENHPGKGVETGPAGASPAMRWAAQRGLASSRNSPLVSWRAGSCSFSGISLSRFEPKE